ncbi:transcriptional regulator [Arthrobacter sp. MYb224]|uniref:helix-turn-helix domain-containing protein n=1 Tax=Arthrobacter sp. MYb224 TaxID=1848600 RepID=UPI000CFC9B37|nr:helix-turn-helix transcriptional regulator [Arthrobacter sp. MYb224]PRA00200.1 transcriptional regulator [Arthrobacter sp. MYb224]
MSSGTSAESDFHRALAELLAQLRNERHTSQGTLAAELGLDQAAVSRVESGQRRLSVAEAFGWLEALGLDSDESAIKLRDLWREFGGRPPGFWNESARV